MLLEIALNAGSVVLEGAGGIRLPVTTGRPPRRAFAPACWPILWCVCIAVVCSYGEALADRIVSYRIAIFCLISYRIYRFLLWLYRAITTYVHHQHAEMEQRYHTILTRF